LSGVEANTPSPSAGAGVYFDGASARRRQVSIKLGNHLEILEGDRLVDIWPYADIRRADAAPGALRLRSVAARELARLEITDEGFAKAIVARCRLIDGDGVSRGGVTTIIAWSLAAAVSLALIAIYGVPLAADRITPFIPYSLEQRFGEATANQVRIAFGKRICSNSQGLAALDKLTSKLTSAGGLAEPIQVTVLDSRIPNAFALPGGRVYLLSAILDKADNSDELAGILAHELGHVAHRDGLREMISSGGTAFLIGLLFGDVAGSGAVVFGGRALLTSAYSRSAEAGADAFAAKVLKRLGRSPAPLGEFLLRLTGKENEGVVALLASHPLTQDRLAALKAADAPVSAPPLIDDKEWRALKGVCG